MRYLPHLLLLAVIIFIVSLCSKLNANQEKPCLKCLRVYSRCQAEVHTSDRHDEDIRRGCEEAYYACFYKYRCMAGGSQ